MQAEDAAQFLSKTERERERERQRQRDMERKRERERKRQRDMEGKRDREGLSFQYRLSRLFLAVTNPTLFQLGNVMVEGTVHLLDVHDRCELNAVEELAAANTDAMLAKVPIV